MSEGRKYTVDVSVFKGDPDDNWEFRHAGLYFVPDDSTSSYFFHAIGHVRNFEFEWRQDFKPSSSGTFAGQAEVGKTTRAITSDRLIELMSSVMVNNADDEFNCQTWAYYALELLSSAGYLSDSQFSTGSDGMVHIVLQAREMSSSDVV